MTRRRSRELGIRLGRLEPGPLDAITDVAGVRVGHSTIVEGDGRLVVGRGPVRTGVTVVHPHEGDPWRDPVFAGCHTLNGNGELTGLEWVRESGMLGSVIGLTNTHSVGVVRDALIAAEAATRARDDVYWSLPVVGETWDGVLNDINGFHVRPDHVRGALDSAATGPVAEGNVGGGTGMICHGFKGGIGTASRRVPEEDGGYTVGVLVQANHGRRPRLRVAGVAVGEAIDPEEVPLPVALRSTAPPAAAVGPEWAARRGTGSIIGIVATDAPLLPHQCGRLAQRAALGVARSGGLGEHTSGDMFLCFSTGNRGLPSTAIAAPSAVTYRVEALSDAHITPLFEAVVEATEAAILNALLAAETLTGRDGITAHALPVDRLLGILGLPARTAAE